MKPIISPGANPKPAAMGNSEVTIVEEWVALLSAGTAYPATFVNAILVAFYISTHFTFTNLLYDRYARRAGLSYAKGNNIKDNRSHAATAETSWIYINTLLLQSLSEVAFFICYHLLQIDDVFM
jgi:hypothetical protein